MKPKRVSEQTQALWKSEQATNRARSMRLEPILPVAAPPGAWPLLRR